MNVSINYHSAEAGLFAAGDRASGAGAAVGRDWGPLRLTALSQGGQGVMHRCLRS